MKKLLSVILAGALGCSLVACAGAKEVKNETIKPMGFECNWGYRLDTLIQDVNGEHKCLWEDGKIFFDDYFSHLGRYRQYTKSATLSLQTEYDMWFNIAHHDLDFVNCYPVEFEYDETKIEIKPHPDKESHFILKVYQPCDQEKIYMTMTSKSTLHYKLDENGEPYLTPFTRTGLIATISTEE